jgi:hypothetical protein
MKRLRRTPSDWCFEEEPSADGVDSGHGCRERRSRTSENARRVKGERLREKGPHAFTTIDSDDGGRTLGVISMRALGIRSSYKGRTVDA